MATNAKRCRTSARRGELPRRNRGGSVTLEFLLVLPILLTVLLAVVEFGMFFSNMQQVALACRVGAEAASQTDLSGTNDGDAVPGNILQAVNAQLESSGITPCVVFLQHNVPSPGTTETLESVITAGCTCTAPSTQLPLQAPTPPNYGRVSVRLTICVPMTELAPNCLSLFGFNLANRCANCSTTFRYEL